MTLRLTLFTTLLLAPLAALHAAEAPATFHYQPTGAVFGDPVPFQHGGTWHLFHLRRAVDAAGAFPAESAVEWYHLVSRDLVHWEELPPALLADENDRLIATGNIVEHEGVFHAFYSTQNRADKGPGTASVSVATSRDLVTWTKQPGEPLLLLKRDLPALGTYESNPHFRDPHVFWNPQAKEWWLANAAQQKLDPAYPYAGAVAVATSPDLRKWTLRREPMLATREGPASECPDVFPFGKGWAPISYTDTTHMRLADTLDGPWQRPANDTPWGLHLHAAKTMSDGHRRILIRFVPRVASDFAEHESGGVMALPRELYTDAKGQPDGWNRMPHLRTKSIALPTDRPVKLHVMLHGDVLDAFLDDRLSLSARVQLPTGGLSLLARDGTVQLHQLRIAQLPERKTP